MLCIMIQSQNTNIIDFQIYNKLKREYILMLAEFSLSKSSKVNQNTIII